MDQYAYVVNVEGAVVRDGEYLLIERSPAEEHAGGLLGFPGGKVEHPPGESAPVEQTARRELREEVGIEVGTVEYVCSRTFQSDTGKDCINIVTRCEHERGQPRPREPAEVAAVHWLSPEQIQSHENAPGYLLEYVERIETHRNGE